MIALDLFEAPTKEISFVKGKERASKEHLAFRPTTFETMEKLSLHPGAVNIARRYTEMNENDLVMVREKAVMPLVGRCPTIG